MGLGDFFRRRKESESAVPPSSTEVGALGSFASSDGQPVVGQPVGEQDAAQTIDMRGSALGDEIRDIMRQHGIDPDGGGATGQVDASAMPAMQQQILEALGKHGIDPNASGSSLKFGPDEDEK